MGSSSQQGLIIAPSEEADGDNLGKAILMSKHILQFHDTIRKSPQKSLNICLLELLEEFRRDLKNKFDSAYVFELLRFDCI